MTETIENEVPARDLSLEPHPKMPAIQPQQATTPMAMLSMAVAQGADIDKLEKLMALNERFQAAQAKQAFTAAMAAFKAQPPIVTKDRENHQYGSRYTSIGNMVNTVNAALSPHGLSARWDVTQDEVIQVTCVLTHALGHSEQCSMAGPPDATGKKNALQEIKSTVTYLKLATFEAVTGVASSDANADDDGNGAGKSSGMPEPQFLDHLAAIDAAADLASLQTAYAKAYRAADAAKDQPAKTTFIQKKDARKKALTK